MHKSNVNKLRLFFFWQGGEESSQNFPGVLFFIFIQALIWFVIQNYFSFSYFEKLFFILGWLDFSLSQRECLHFLFTSVVIRVYMKWGGRGENQGFDWIKMVHIIMLEIFVFIGPGWNRKRPLISCLFFNHTILLFFDMMFSAPMHTFHYSKAKRLRANLTSNPLIIYTQKINMKCEIISYCNCVVTNHLVTSKHHKTNISQTYHKYDSLHSAHHPPPPPPD